ncbi:MAG TPA: DUF4340 domain-containing protein [Candidatus Dormibacteraeota bacterium]|nr:DUF4340 domain-containing protein [Candidatus Dormibacteraeota bacterium]
MSNKGLYAAAAIFLIALGAWYIYDKGKTPVSPSASSTATPTTLASPVVALDPNQIGQVEIKAKNKILTIVRSNLTFTYQLCPADQPTNCQPQIADQASAIQLFTSIVQLRPARTIFGVNDFPGFGLDRATTGEFTVSTASGQKTTLWIGGKTTDGVNDYVRTPGGNDVYAIPVASIDVPILGLVDNPPVPRPSPSPGAATASPQSSP